MHPVKCLGCIEESDEYGATPGVVVAHNLHVVENESALGCRVPGFEPKLELRGRQHLSIFCQHHMVQDFTNYTIY